MNPEAGTPKWLFARIEEALEVSLYHLFGVGNSNRHLATSHPIIAEFRRILPNPAQRAELRYSSSKLAELLWNRIHGAERFPGLYRQLPKTVGNVWRLGQTHHNFAVGARRVRAVGKTIRGVHVSNCEEPECPSLEAVAPGNHRPLWKVLDNPLGEV